MKNILLFSVSLLFSMITYGQTATSCDPILGWVLFEELGGTDFSGNTSSKFNLQIDNSIPSNLWQVGAVTKPGFAPLSAGYNAIQTDTSAPYASNNESIFHVWTDSLTFTATQDSIVSLQFWHYYDIDSIGDSCIVQMTLDSGNTWLDYSDFNSLPPQLEYNYQVPVNLLPNNSGKFLWTGTSTGWQEVKICFIYHGVKPSRSIPWPVGFRFLFKSDAIQNNKPGWMIDKINFRTPSFTVGLNEHTQNSLSIYPNPSNNGLFTISFPSTYVTGKFILFDYLGRNVKSIELKEQIDLSDLPEGLYLYQAVFDKTNQRFSGKLEIG